MHSPGNPHEYLHKPYIARNWSHWLQLCLDSIVYHHSNVSGGPRNRMNFERECVMAVKVIEGH